MACASQEGVVDDGDSGPEAHRDGWEGGVVGPGEEPRRDASHPVREAVAAVGEEGVLPYATG